MLHFVEETIRGDLTAVIAVMVVGAFFLIPFLVISHKERALRARAAFRKREGWEE